MKNNKLKFKPTEPKEEEFEISYVNSIVISSKTLQGICRILDCEVLINPRIAKVANELHQISMERQAYEMQMKELNKKSKN